MPRKNNKLQQLANHKWVVGRVETLDFPELNLHQVECKVDTGAYTCSLHCSHIDVEYINGEPKLRVVPLSFRHKGYETQILFFPYSPKKHIKNSAGLIEERYTIVTPVRIFGVDILTEFSLTDRSTMKYPVLLGRSFLMGRFMVDVSQINLSLKYIKTRMRQQNALKK